MLRLRACFLCLAAFAPSKLQWDSDPDIRGNGAAAQPIADVGKQTLGGKCRLLWNRPGIAGNSSTYRLG